MTSEDGWKHLGNRVVERRVELGMETTTALSEATGLSTRILGDLENGRKASYRQATLLKVLSALGWANGSIEEILEGRDPIPEMTATVAHSRYAKAIERDAATKFELSKLTSEQLAQGIRDRVDELRRRVDTADHLFAEVARTDGDSAAAFETQGDYDLVADDGYGYSHEDEDELREMEP